MTPRSKGHTHTHIHTHIHSAREAHTSNERVEVSLHRESVHLHSFQWTRNNYCFTPKAILPHADACAVVSSVTSSRAETHTVDGDSASHAHDTHVRQRDSCRRTHTHTHSLPHSTTLCHCHSSSSICSFIRSKSPCNPMFFGPALAGLTHASTSARVERERQRHTHTDQGS